MSEKAVNIHFDPTGDAVQCAILGAGVLGLMTAIQLTKKGKKVTVYAEQIPNLESRTGTHIASGEMSVVWMPKDYDWSEDMLKH